MISKTNSKVGILSLASLLRQAYLCDQDKRFEEGISGTPEEKTRLRLRSLLKTQKTVDRTFLAQFREKLRTRRVPSSQLTMLLRPDPALLDPFLFEAAVAKTASSRPMALSPAFLPPDFHELGNPLNGVETALRECVKLHLFEGLHRFINNPRSPLAQRFMLYQWCLWAQDEEENPDLPFLSRTIDQFITLAYKKQNGAEEGARRLEKRIVGVYLHRDVEVVSSKRSSEGALQQAVALLCSEKILPLLNTPVGARLACLLRDFPHDIGEPFLKPLLEDIRVFPLLTMGLRLVAKMGKEGFRYREEIKQVFHSTMDTEVLLLAVDTLSVIFPPEHTQELMTFLTDLISNPNSFVPVVTIALHRALWKAGQPQNPEVPFHYYLTQLAQNKPLSREFHLAALTGLSELGNHLPKGAKNKRRLAAVLEPLLAQLKIQDVDLDKQLSRELHAAIEKIELLSHRKKSIHVRSKSPATNAPQTAPSRKVHDLAWVCTVSPKSLSDGEQDKLEITLRTLAPMMPTIPPKLSSALTDHLEFLVTTVATQEELNSLRPAIGILIATGRENTLRNMVRTCLSPEATARIPRGIFQKPQDFYLHFFHKGVILAGEVGAASLSLIPELQNICGGVLPKGLLEEDTPQYDYLKMSLRLDAAISICQILACERQALREGITFGDTVRKTAFA